MSEPRRIAVIGAECAGKTTLCADLAQALPGHWLPEYLREFCEEKRRPPTLDEQRFIVGEQMTREHAGLAHARHAELSWVISDSTPLVTALYSMEYFGDQSLLEAAIEYQRGYDLTVLADIDMPWLPDGIQRDGPDVRERCHQQLRQLLNTHNLPHVVARGAPLRRVKIVASVLASQIGGAITSLRV